MYTYDSRISVSETATNYIEWYISISSRRWVRNLDKEDYIRFTSSRERSLKEYHFSYVERILWGYFNIEIFKFALFHDLDGQREAEST